jgi:hypothetical protein
MKTVFTHSSVVTGIATLSANMTADSPSADTYQVEDDVAVSVGDLVVLSPEGVPTFTPAPAKHPTVTAIRYYSCFKPTERIAIKTSTDPLVQELWSTLQLSLAANSDIDLNLGSVNDALAYLAYKTLIAPERVAEILTGTPL